MSFTIALAIDVRSVFLFDEFFVFSDRIVLLALLRAVAMALSHWGDGVALSLFSRTRLPATVTSSWGRSSSTISSSSSLAAILSVSKELPF